MILKHSRIFSLIIILLSAQLSWAGSITSVADLPNYYSSVEGTTGSTLWSAVHTVAKVGYSTSVSYNNVWTIYATTDSYMDGSTKKIYDMYGGCDFTYGASSSGGDQCGNYDVECDCYNREHSIPKSWFGGSENANTPGSDVFHLVPTDGKINNTRSNYAFGEVATASKTHNTNGMVNKLGTAKSITIENTMMGTSVTKSCSSSPVFEPDDIYKGDFARGYFGTLLKWAGDYQAFTTDDGSAMFSGTYTESGHWGLTEYGIALLLKWHRQDPVSQKEIDRNNGIQQTQGNRNPFIDYPILAEYIWGKYAGETFSLSNAVGSFDTDNFTPGVSDGDKAAGPTITVNPTSLTLDPVAVNGTSTKTFTVTGSELTSTISISRTDESNYFTVSQSSITSGYNGTNTIIVTYHPTAIGDHTATFTITSSGAMNKTVTVYGTCTTVHTATWMANGSQYHQNTAADGSAPVIPSAPDDCGDDRVFMGWTENGSYSGDGSDLFTDEAPTMNTDKTFYAVYADKETSGSGVTTYILASSIAVGDQVIIACNTVNTTAGALSNQVLGSVSSTFSSDKSTISSLGSGTLIFTVGGTNGAYTLSTSDGALGATAVKKLAFDQGTTTWSITISSGTATITNGTSSYGSMRYNSGSPRFTTYASGQTAVQLYKATGGTTTTYSNYSTDCNEGTKVTITFNANGGEGMMAAQQVPQSTSRNLNTCTFTRTHYTFAGWATSSGGSVVYADGATVNTSTDLNLYAKWTEASQYTVTFMNMGVAYGEPITDYAGESIGEISNPTACEGYTFVGWSTATQATEATSKPSTTTPTTIPAENTTYHAVYSRTESSGSGDPVITYEKVTEAPSDWSGNYLIVYETDSKVFNGLSSKGSYETTTITTGVIAHTDALELCEVVIAKMTGDNYSIQMNSSATNNASKYLSGTSGSNTMNFGESASENTIALSGSDVLLTSNTSVLRFNNDANNGNMFRYYKASGYSNQKAIQLYQRIETGGSSSTTYYTTSPNCCKATLTVQSPDDTIGTVSIE